MQSRRVDYRSGCENRSCRVDNVSNAFYYQKMYYRTVAIGLSIPLFMPPMLGYFAKPVLAQSESFVPQPQVATIKRMVNGDLMCYVTLVDQYGKAQEWGATFDLCNQQKQFLNRTVRLDYGAVNVNDCQSAEPCGKTRQAILIVQMRIANGDNVVCGRGASAGYTIPRLQVGQNGRSLTTLNVRQQSRTSSAIVGILAPNSRFKVVQGPQCTDSHVWWKVNTGQLQGWVAEGDPATFKYWLEPLK